MTNFSHHIRSLLHHIIKISGANDISTSLLLNPIAESRFRDFVFQTHQFFETTYYHKGLSEQMYDFMVTVFVRVEWDPEDWM